MVVVGGADRQARRRARRRAGARPARPRRFAQGGALEWLWSAGMTEARGDGQNRLLRVGGGAAVPRPLPPPEEAALGLRSYLTATPGIGGRLRGEPEDFVVVEL